MQVGEQNYYLLSLTDVYSRYSVHHELLGCMDGLSVATEAAAAIETLDRDARPDIQSDHGSGSIVREFAETLREAGVTYKKIRLHTLTDNAEIERCQRTIGERIDELDLEDVTEAKAVIAGIANNYNNVRLHSALSPLRPVDYYRGDPAALLAERRRELKVARELAQAGEHEAATARPPLGGRRNRHLSKTPMCLTLSETNQWLHRLLQSGSLGGSTHYPVRQHVGPGQRHG